jgi:O-antigen/teichoic acid export membrane protein
LTPETSEATRATAGGEAWSLRRLGRDAAVYGAGVVLSRAVSFLLLPLYTRYLTPADFGLLQLLQILIDVVSIAVSAGTTAGVLRFYFKATTEEERGRVVITAFYLLGGLNLLGAILLTPLAPFLWKHALGGAGSPVLIPLAACNFVLEACLTVPLLLMQARRRPGLYSTVTLSKLTLGLALNVLFVVGFGKGVAGILVANVIANVVVGLGLVVWMIGQTGWRPSASAARDLRRFGIPHQWMSAGTFILTFGDRWFLQAYHGLAVVGLYGLAYQFGFVLVNLTSAPYFRAWAPHRLALATTLPREARDARYNQAFRYLNLLVITAAAGISLYAWPLIALVSAPAFRPAALLVPLLLAAFVVQIWTDVVALGIEVSEKTKYASYATWISVVAILALYALLIPRWGGMGAAVATLGGNLVRLAFFLRFAQRLWPVGWEWQGPLRMAAVAAVIVAIEKSITPVSWIAQVTVATALFAVFAGVTWALVLNARERAQLAGFVRSPGSAFSWMASA